MIARSRSRVVKDDRDAVFLCLILRLSLLVPFATAIYATSARWWLSVPYLGLVLYWLGPFVLMTHQLAHRPGTFRPAFRWLASYASWILGPLFGQSPGTYVGHHIGMHHPENNLGGDLSSTLGYRRDSFTDFLAYWFDFLLFGFVKLAGYLRRRGRRKMFWQTVVGELAFFAVVAGLFAWNAAATTVVFVVPLLACRFLMLAGNWAQHAFVDPTRPADPLLNSITCVETTYNDRCFNDGYHALHHLKPAMHWADLRAAFTSGAATFRERGAIVVRGLDHFQVWALLMTKQHRVIARHLVMPELGSEEERVSLLKQRLSPVVP